MKDECCRCVYSGLCDAEHPDGCCVTVEQMNEDTYREVKEEIYEVLGWHTDDEWFNDPQ